MINIKMLLTLFLSTLGAIACTSVISSDDSVSSLTSMFEAGECNLSPAKLGFAPGSVLEDFPTPIPMTNVWEPQLEEGQAQGYFINQTKKIIARSNNEIWLLSFFDTLLRFTPSNQEIVEYAPQSIPSSAQDIILIGMGRYG